MTPGPQRTPTNVLEARGSSLAPKRRKTEPTPSPGRPKCPAWLGDDAKRVWKQLLPILEQMRVCTKADLHHLMIYCERFAHWQQCIEFLRENGDTFELKRRLQDGSQVVDVKPHSQVRTAQAEGDALLKLGDRLGLSPSARARLSIEPEVKTDLDEERLFKMTKGA